MARKYNLGSKSDMRRLTKDLEKAVMEKATSAMMKMKYDITCPHCQANIQAPVGKSLCSLCRQQIDLNINIR